MSTPKILVADDSVTIQKVIRLALSHEGYEIRGVSHENELIEQVSLFQPDIMIIDSTLSGKSAFDIKKELKDNKKLKFILMSNTFDVIDEEKLKESEFHARLTKPFDPGQLRETIQSLFTTETMDENSSEDIKPFHEDPHEENEWTINETAKKGLLNNLSDKDEELHFEMDSFPQDPTDSYKSTDNEIEFDLDLNIEKSNEPLFREPSASSLEHSSTLHPSFSEKDVKSIVESELRKITQKLLPEIAEKILKEEINRLLDHPPQR